METQTINDNEILLVDDNPENLRVLMAILKSEGYKTRVAKNGEQALKSVESAPPSMILLDIQMPKMDGFETCKVLKENPETVDIPIIFISALSDTLDKVKAFKSGAVDYVEKPFYADEVIARMEAHLTIQQQKTELEIAFQNLKDTQEELLLSERKASLILVQEMSHRVKNNLQSLIGLLSLQISKMDNIEAIDSLKTCKSRTATMSIMHDLLYSEHDLHKVMANTYFEKQLDYLRELYDDSEVKIVSDIAEMEIDSSALLPLGLLVNELVTNSFKHGFKNGGKGIINVELSEEGHNWRLRVSDNGEGVSDVAQLQTEDGLGHVIVEALSGQLDAELQVKSEKGKGVEYQFSFSS